MKKWKRITSALLIVCMIVTMDMFISRASDYEGGNAVQMQDETGDIGDNVQSSGGEKQKAARRAMSLCPVLGKGRLAGTQKETRTLCYHLTIHQVGTQIQILVVR